MGTEEIGNRIRQIRRAKDLPQQALAARAGVTVATVSRLERGKHDATVTTLRKIAEGLGVTLGALILEEDEQPAAPVVEVVKVEDIFRYFVDGYESMGEDEVKKVEDAIAPIVVRRSFERKARQAKEGK
jgi:transcriptional regulator with XRE-family HTH domain